MFPLRLTLLGGFEASLSSGRLLALSARKNQALLAYLAIRPGLSHAREKLAALLWGDTPDERARHSLRQALVSLRSHLPAEPPALIESGTSITANAEAIEVDVLAFERFARMRTRDALERAVALYRGDLLDGLNVGEQAFDDWLLGERERLREMAVETLSRLLTAQIKDDSIDAAVETGVRLLTLDPAHEAGHRALMRLYVRQGRRAAALRQYQTCVGVLERELGGEPEGATKALYQDLIRLGAPGATSAGARAEVQEERIDTLGSETPLVGRDEDLARLRAQLEAARERRSSVAIVFGEAGIGKSRLVSALAASVHDDEHVMIGRAYETERILPFGPWLSALRGETVLTGDVVRGLEPVWRTELARLFPELGARDPAPLPSPQDPARLFEACAQLLTRLAARGTIVLVLEDLHWADEMTLRLLAFLARRAHAARVLIVLTARDEDLADAPVLAQLVEELRAERRLLAISLSPLTRDETRQLVRALGRTRSRGDDMASVHEHVWQVSQGHPFTAVELMRALAASPPAEPTQVLQVPERVRDVIAARLSRLGPGAQELVAVAAVIGRASGFGLLQRAARLGEREAAEAIEELVRRRVFQGVGKEFDFVHDRVRTVAYGRLLEPRRRALHAAVVAALEGIHVERIEDVWDALAYHAERAEDAVRAVTFLAHASDKSLRTYAVADAIAAVERAIALVPQLPAADRDRWLVDLTLRRGLMLSLLGRHREIPALFAPHAERLDRLGDPHFASAWHFRLALTVSMLGDQKGSADHAQRAVDHAVRAGDHGAMGRGRYALGLAVYIAGDLRAGAEHAREAIRDLEHAGDQMYLGYAYWVLALASYQLGALDPARDATRQIDVIGVKLGDDKLRNYAAWTLGWIEASTGDPDAAIAACARGIDYARDMYGRAQAVGVLGYAWVEKGDAKAAIAALEDSLKMLRELRVRQMEGRYSAFLSEAFLLAGDRARAREAAEQSLQLTLDTSHAYGVALARRALGRVAAADGALKEAAARLREALDVFASLGARFEEARTELILADVLSAIGDKALAAGSLSRARAAFVELGAPRYVERVDARLR